jgi:hypothetical protein
VPADPPGPSAPAPLDTTLVEAPADLGAASALAVPPPLPPVPTAIAAQAPEPVPEPVPEPAPEPQLAPPPAVPPFVPPPGFTRLRGDVWQASPEAWAGADALWPPGTAFSSIDLEDAFLAFARTGPETPA